MVAPNNKTPVLPSNKGYIKQDKKSPIVVKKSTEKIVTEQSIAHKSKQSLISSDKNIKNMKSS